MILRTYRDVEIELRKLQAAINDIPKIKENGGLNTAQVIALINQQVRNTTIVNTVQNEPKDLDSSNAGTLIIHKLVHQFLEKVIFDGVVSINDNLVISGDLTVGGNALIAGNLGSAAQRILKGWFKDLSVLPNLTPSVAGQVLTAVDTVGNTAWSTLPVSTNVGSLTEVVLSSNVAIANVLTNVPGLVSTLPTAGVYLITVNCNITFQVNDTAIELYLQVFGSGSASNGIIRIGKPAANATEEAVVRSWRINATASGVVVQIAAVKGGSAGSFILAPATLLIQRVS